MILARAGHRDHGARVWVRALFWAAIAALWLAPRPAAAAEDKGAFDQRIMAELEAQSPDAARVFRSANEARERGDFTRARDLYREVRRLAPGFYHATRRLCGVEGHLEHRAEALTLCREALAAADTPENLSALASTLAMTPHTSAEVDEAQRLSTRAISVAPDDASVRATSCSVAIAKQNLPDLGVCVHQLEAIAPNEVSTHVYAVIFAATGGRIDDARASLERARAMGLSSAEYDRFSGMLDEATPLPMRIFSTGWRVGVAWIGSFVLLLALGWILSRAALRAAGRVPQRTDGHPHGAEKTLRQVYRGVLWLCCAFYYLSIPLLLILTLLAGGGLIFGFFALGRIPIKLVLIIAVITFSTVWAVLKSVFVRARQVDPGVRLDLDEHPRLRALLDEVAGKIGTPSVNTVFLTPGTDLAVMERSGMRGLLGGASERCLILGAGVLRGMKVLELKSILAHEHGHFHNEDTAGGGFALAVRRSLFTMAIALAQSGVAAWYNPVWLFLRAFHKVFLIISQGASRLQEVLADRWAVRTYGSESFERGLRHVIRRSALFDAHVDATLNEVVSAKLPLLNLYTYKPQKRKDVEQAIEEAINAEPSAYDSHPSPRDRFTWAAALGAPPPEASPDDAEPAWSLFSDRRQLEEQMTDEVRAQILASHAVAIPRPRREKKAAAPEPEAEAEARTGTDAG